MAATNPITPVHNGFIKEIRRLIGSRLATLPSSGAPLAAVIKDRVKGIRPDYHFIVVDVESSLQETPWVKDQYYDEQTDVQVYVTEQKVPLRVTCYGRESLDILNELRIRLDFDVDRHLLNDATGAVFNRFTDLTDVPAFLSTDFVESSTMVGMFYTTTEFRPDYDDAKDITRVIAEGDFYRTIDKSDEPFEVIIDEDNLP